VKLAVIPARGGSKRIPRKNIRNFCGKPMISYSIDAAKQSCLFDQVIVSTEDEEIAVVAQHCGARVPFTRPAELADDHTGTNAVVKHAIEWYLQRGQGFDLVCCIYATAPFLRPEYLAAAHDLLINSSKSFVFSVAAYAFPIQRAVRLNGDGEVEAIRPEHRSSRSQDLEETYHDAGQFYWGRPSAFLADETLFSSASLALVLPRDRVQDIDTPEDWRRAQWMYRAMELGETEP